MAIKLLYFAWVREAIGCDGETVDPPADVDTVEELVNWLSLKSERYGDVFTEKSRLRVAVDQEFAGFETSLAGVREVAIFPPVTGG